MVTDVSHDTTEVGNYFIANYPPFAFWKRENLPAIESVLARPPHENAPLGLYLHIPFCRKRCKFCYFRVYTDVNAHAIQNYVDALAHEVMILSEQPAVAGRQVRFAYFGGGTPSYLSAKQLNDLATKLRQHLTWDQAVEVTFECEPGTLSEPKLQAIKDIGVTRLSLGIENFDDAILEENGRAHLSHEIYRAWDWIVARQFAQVNVDLIAGMVGETWENWRENIRKTIELSPDSVTIYQMELPYNTRYTKAILQEHQPIPFATWSTKRDWVDFAFDELTANGYRVSSAYTLIKEDCQHGFEYRDSLWHGADLLGTGVASFGHLQGVHYQNIDGLEPYQQMLAENKLPLGRALIVTDTERFIRELILQMKTGSLDLSYFRAKFGRDPLHDFREQFDDLVSRGYGEIDGDEWRLTRDGLLRADSLLPAFFLPEHRTERYV